MDLASCLAVAFGGALGTLGRYGLATLLSPWSQSLPVGTIVINVLGSFVIGFFGTLTLAQGRMPVPEQVRLFVMVGLCGGFTTFSSFSLQTLDLIRGGSLLKATLNVTLSVVLCLAAVALGHAVAAQFNRGAVQVAQVDIEEEA